MQQLHSEIITSPYDGGLLGSRNAHTNDVISSGTMICSLAPPQLRPMTDHQKLFVVVPFLTLQIIFRNC